MLTVATWNVNSIRARQERAVAWLRKVEPDVLCLQELKVVDEDFPYDTFTDLGYESIVFGQKTYNGVAILSKLPAGDVTRGFMDDEDDPESRAVSTVIAGCRIFSLYVPNGRSVGSDKWIYKKRWYERLLAYLNNSCSASEPLLLCGDFNVAPEHADVANPEKWNKSVLFHPEARSMLDELKQWGLVDTVRIHHVGEGPFTWWDYRMLAFPKGDGLRIDHILATGPMADVCESAWVDRDERKGKKPSDHAPVVAEFNWS